MDLKGRGRKRKNEKEREKGRVKKEKKRECGNLPFREWLGLPRDIVIFKKCVFGNEKMGNFWEISGKMPFLCVFGKFLGDFWEVFGEKNSAIFLEERIKRL